MVMLWSRARGRPMGPMFIAGRRRSDGLGQILRPRSRNPRLRKSFPRRADGLSLVDSAHHASRRAGLRRETPGERRSHRSRRPYRASFLNLSIRNFALQCAALCCALIPLGCHSPTHAQPGPASSYQSIRGEMLAGNLDRAKQDAQKARSEFAPPGGDWETKFRLLQAEILTYQGLSSEVVPLLACDAANDPATGDAAIQRYLFCSLAHVRLGQSQKSAEELHQAQQLAGETHSSLQGEVFLSQGLIERHFDHLARAKEAFTNSLEIARRNHDAFLEARDLLSLGWLAVQVEHYDEAVALLNQAATAAKPIQARTVI